MHFCDDCQIRPRSANEDSTMSVDSKGQSAKFALRRLKTIRKALATVSGSLEETFELVTDQSTDVLRISGFSSLPDDVLARILEMNHQAYKKAAERIGTKQKSSFVFSSNSLAQVCRRFRRIILHLPSLWEVVSNTHGKRWISEAKARCHNPIVFIAYKNPGVKKSLDKFLKSTIPAKHWKGLDVRLGAKAQFREIFDCISASPKGQFPSLESLSLQLEESSTSHSFIDSDDSEDEDQWTVDMSNSESSLLSKWRLPKLRRVTLENFIPYGLKCPNVQECDILLGDMDRNYGDLRALIGFLGCLQSIESLKLTFINIYISSVSKSTKPIKFSRLTSLELSIQGCTEEKFLKGVLDAMDMTTLSDLKISMCPIDVIEDNNFQEKVGGWLNSIFNLSAGKGKRRTFPNVEAFSLELVEATQSLPYKDMFFALPRVRDLKLQLPRCSDPTFPPHSLTNLRSLHYLNCNFFKRGTTFDFLKERIEDGGMEKVEIEGCYNLKHYKDDFEGMLGNKFVWEG